MCSCNVQWVSNKIYQTLKAVTVGSNMIYFNAVVKTVLQSIFSHLQGKSDP